MPRVCILSSVHEALDNRVFYREARSLERAGYQVTLVAVHARDEVRDRVQILALPRVRRWQRPLVWIRLLRLALGTHADIYHFHDPELLLVMPFLRLMTGKPTVYDIHESYPEFIEVKDYLPRWLRLLLAWVFRWLEPALARLQSGLIFSDAQIADAFAGIRCPKATLYNFPDCSFIGAAAASARDIRQREPVVLYLGGMERNRGSRLLIEAFQRVHEAMRQARLLMVGHFEPAELANEIRADAGRRGIAGALTIAGRVPFEDIGAYLARAAVGWVPWQPVAKNQKNVPTKLFEYMAYGLPVVSSDLSSTRPFVDDGNNGYLVPADDPKAHADAILSLLGDPQAAESMGKRGQERVQAEYNWDKMARRLVELYRQLGCVVP